MSTLVVLIPPRPRARSPGSATVDTPRRETEYVYVVTSSDGLAVQTEGRAAPGLLPKRATTVAVLADTDVSWHRITLPKAPAARLRAALDGVLEDALLEDTAAVHLALPPQPVAGRPVWVAAVDRHWLRAELATLERAELFVDRVVPMSCPGDPPLGHFAVDAADPASGAVLHWAHAEGVASVRLQGGLARSIVPSPAPDGTRFTATPAAAEAAEAWLGAPVVVATLGTRLLQATRNGWDLRQFDLARRARGARAFADALRRFMSPEWRAARYGLVGLVLAQVVGLNAWAWHQRGVVDAKRAEMLALVSTTFPKASVQDIARDPEAVLQREASALRTLAGKPGENDLEPLLQAAASAWPPELPPVDNLRFEPGKLTLAATGWSDAQVQQFRERLQPGGWRVDAVPGSVTISRLPAAARSAT